MKSPSTVTVGDYTRILGRSWLVVVLAVVGGAAVGWLAHSLQPAHYESQAKMLITVPGPATVTADYAADLSGRLNAETFRNLVTTRQVLTRVIVDDGAKELGTNVTVGELSSRLTATAVPSSSVVTLTATGDSARSAVVLASLVSRVTKEVVDELTSTNGGGPQTDVSTIDSATPAVKVSKTSLTTSLGLGAGIGFAVALVALVGRDLVLNRVVDGVDALHSLRDAKGELA